MPQRNETILARWQTSMENVSCSPLEFYQMIEDLLTVVELPGLSFSQVSRKEGSWFSTSRVYLRIRYQRFFFDVSAFFVGNALVIGWWLHQDSGGLVNLLAEIPGLGFFLERNTRAATYYQVDYLEYFQRAIHTAVLRVVDELGEENGLPFLSYEARIPIWEEIW